MLDWMSIRECAWDRDGGRLLLAAPLRRLIGVGTHDVKLDHPKGLKTAAKGAQCLECPCSPGGHHPASESRAGGR